MVDLKSKSFFKELQLIFLAESNTMLYTHVARLIVLYEDLRIELYGVSRKSIKALDHIDKYRPIYFLRRSIATLYEFAEECRLLDNCSDSQHLKERFDDQSKKQWEDAIKFFKEKDKLIKLVRHDMGGHFGLCAAKYAVENIRPNVVGKVELEFRHPHKANLKLHFAGEIAATVLGKHLSGSSSKEKFGNFFKEILNPGYKHATSFMIAIGHSFLLPRFKH